MVTKVGYLGPTLKSGESDRTTFGYQAAKKHFPDDSSVAFKNYPSHPEICNAVAREEVDYGVVAVENTLAGFVSDTLSGIRDTALLSHGVEICGETVVSVELFLLRREMLPELPKRIISKAEALKQCSIVLREYKSRGVEVDGPASERPSTGGAAEEAAANAEVAVVGTCLAEEQYKLVRMQPRSIVDVSPAFTRFWVIGKHRGKRTGNDKTAVLISLKQKEEGALFRALGAFEAHAPSDGEFKLKPDGQRPNLLCLHTIPIGSRNRQWEYHFLLEFAGHVDDPSIAQGLAAFAESGLSEAKYATVLGSYPAGT
jgi:chorismate mutase / prephenate dehydratase